MSPFLKEFLEAYVSHEGRSFEKIERLVNLLSVTKDPIEFIAKVCRKNKKPFKLFRCLILMHECFLEKLLDPAEAIEVLAKIKKYAKPQNNNPLEILVCEKAISGYSLFLQKCFLSIQAEEMNEFDSIEILYRTINLLSLGLNFVDILYTFGRYYLKSHQFIIDFNILLARHFRTLYETIKSMLIRNKNIWEEQMKSELELIHEKMYVVYYNCYTYKEVKPYVPKWIDTEESGKKKEREPRSTSKISKSRSQVKSIEKRAGKSGKSASSTADSLSLSRFELSKSLFFTKREEKVQEIMVSQFEIEEEDELKSVYSMGSEKDEVIASLERVIELIDENELKLSLSLTIQN